MFFHIFGINALYINAVQFALDQMKKSSKIFKIHLLQLDYLYYLQTGVFMYKMCLCWVNHIVKHLRVA